MKKYIYLTSKINAMDSKKAMEISPPSLVVVIILALVVLVILLFIFGGQSKMFVNIINMFRGEVTGEKCQSSVFMRYCDCPTGYIQKEIVPPPPGKDSWEDCQTCWECIKE